MPDIVIIAGPNGAGKTSFATEYLTGARAGWQFVNADEIVAAMHDMNLTTAERDLRAGRIMLRQIANLVNREADFALETTLATLGYARKIPLWQRLGYSVELIYLRLANAEQAIARVRRRVAAGGHHVPDKVVRRRFDRSRDYLLRVYKPIVDECYIFDSLEGEFRRVETWIGT